MEDIPIEAKSPDYKTQRHAPGSFEIRFFLPICAGCGTVSCEPAADGGAVDELEGEGEEPD
jgi:hypothetical protein